MSKIAGRSNDKALAKRPKMKRIEEPSLARGGCMICAINPVKTGVYVRWSGDLGDGVYCADCIRRLRRFLRAAPKPEASS